MRFINLVNSYGSTIYVHEPVGRAEYLKSRVLAFTDRGLYQAGEELALRGGYWIQTLEGVYSLQWTDEPVIERFSQR